MDVANGRIGVGIIGCGNIAAQYARQIEAYPEVELVGVADQIPERARALAERHGVRAYADPDEQLADDRVELVVNLTTHHAHKEVITRALEAGKHVHSEKPLALSYEDAREVVELAKRKGLRLGCSPATFLGEAQQTAWKLIREGRAGTVRLAYAEVNWGRIESWHPEPESFYAVGPLFDVGVYPLTLLTCWFGPARRVLAAGRVLYPDRRTREGRPFHIETPELVIAVVELEDGVLVRLTVDFYVSQRTKQKGIELHGDEGYIYLSNWQSFNADVEAGKFDEPYEPVPLVREPYPGPEWARGVQDMAMAIQEGRPHRATGEQAAHVVEILCAVTESVRSGGWVEVCSSFTPPKPMPWAE